MALEHLRTTGTYVCAPFSRLRCTCWLQRRFRSGLIMMRLCDNVFRKPLRLPDGAMGSRRPLMRERLLVPTSAPPPRPPSSSWLSSAGSFDGYANRGASTLREGYHRSLPPQEACASVRRSCSSFPGRPAHDSANHNSGGRSRGTGSQGFSKAAEGRPTNYFKLLSLTPSFDLDDAAIRRVYLSLQAKHHPDKRAAAAAHAGAHEQQHAEEEEKNEGRETLKAAASESAAISEAYVVLLTASRRLRHFLLTQFGVDLSTDSIRDEELLHEMFETSEDIEEGDEATLVELSKTYSEKLSIGKKKASELLRAVEGEEEKKAKKAEIEEEEIEKEENGMMGNCSDIPTSTFNFDAVARVANEMEVYESILRKVKDRQIQNIGSPTVR
eukprot:GHVU01036453.1.p1 GENE.GHVU01036453.1~~GHVU01036453.1.p1  ORF type:complete len:384 (+),score=68.32 GHVU01036453.1:327-1478(+)